MKKLFFTILFFVAIIQLITSQGPEKRKVPQGRRRPMQKPIINPNNSKNNDGEEILDENVVDASGDSNLQDQPLKDGTVIKSIPWLEDWEKHMTDFKADTLLSFKIDGKTQETFIENIKKPCNIRGAYFSSFDSKEPLNFYIRGPNKKIIWKRDGKKEGIFSINVTEIGDYFFVFNNKKWSADKILSFAIDVSDDETHLQEKDIDPIFERFNNIEYTINELHQQTKFEDKKKNSHAEAYGKTHNRLMFFSIIETLTIIFCTGWQIYFIKKILDNRSIV